MCSMILCHGIRSTALDWGAEEEQNYRRAGRGGLVKMKEPIKIALRGGLHRNSRVHTTLLMTPLSSLFQPNVSKHNPTLLSSSSPHLQNTATAKATKNNRSQLPRRLRHNRKRNESKMIRPTLLIGTVVLAGAGAVAAFHLSPTNNGGGIAAPPAASSTSTVNRRDFVSKSAGMVAAGLALPRAVVAVDDSSVSADPYADYVTSESGMRYLITKEGDGAVPSAGQLVKVRPVSSIFSLSTSTTHYCVSCAED
jgi:hypothetical protein